MVEWTPDGLVISGSELLTEHGKALCLMADEIERLRKELEIYKDLYATELLRNRDV